MLIFASLYMKQPHAEAMNHRGFIFSTVLVFDTQEENENDELLLRAELYELEPVTLQLV